MFPPSDVNVHTHRVHLAVVLPDVDEFLLRDMATLLRPTAIN